ncbi:MAG: N(4)-(beta-N-acetylglucosaminyl)-L-asparaginase [Acidobacteriota bacterium]
MVHKYLCSRRSFFSRAAYLVTGAAVMDKFTGSLFDSRSAPVSRPLIVTSKTNKYVTEPLLTAAWKTLDEGGSPLDAAEKAVNISEADPRDRAVGYGGLPNEEGVLQLDASCMDGPTYNAGAVACMENIKTPCSVARLVMERTDHLMLVGKGALQFARMHGFKEENLLTEEARQGWVAWKENLSDSDYYHSPEPKKVPMESEGTINVLVLDGNGDMAGVTSTVGHKFKIPGRVGDSPIIGAGLYVDNDVGAAGSTGHGAESIKTCSSFLVVEKMREGMTPQEACEYVCRRIAEKHKGKPMFNVKMVALNKKGEFGQASVRGQIDKETGKLQGLGYAVYDRQGFRILYGKPILPPMTPEERAKTPPR